MVRSPPGAHHRTVPARPRDPPPTAEPIVDLYTLLHVERTVDDGGLRDAYRREARLHHPDAGGQEFYMVALNKAYGILREPTSRLAYDRRLGVARPSPTAARSPARDEALTVPTPTGRPSGSVLDFGRYSGWSIGQLARHDPDYLIWLERTQIGRPMRPEIDAVLGSGGSPR
jgi:curved DNA-binding protein CbpA